MNSRQRRAAYRAMPKVGQVFTYRRGGPVVGRAVSLGPVVFAETVGMQRNTVKNPNRVCAQLLGPGDIPAAGVCHPLVSRIVR